MAHPLELSYAWRLPLTFSTVGLSVCLGALVTSRAPGWVTASLALVAVWAAFLVLLRLRTRAYLLVDGPRLRVRRGRGFRVVHASEVVAVGQIRTPHGLSYRLTLHDAGGTSSRLTVPTALLLGGRSTLLTWILTEAPQAQLDPGTRETIVVLRHRGLVR